MHAQPTVYDGIRYASKAEAQYAERLDFEIKAGSVLWWLPQVTVQLGRDTRYTVDFLVHQSGGGDMPGYVVAIEVKGFETALFRRNKKLWKKYGQFPLHIVKRGETTEVVEPQEN